MKSLRLARPHIIALIGVPGSGKSYFAERFADTFGAPLVSEAALHRLTELTQASVRIIAMYQLEQLVKAEKTIVIDGIGNTRTERAEMGKIARGAGYDILFVWVQTDPATTKLRVAKTNKESGRSEKDTEQLAKQFTPPIATEKAAVISGKHTYAAQARTVLKRLSAPRAEAAHTVEAPSRPQPAGSQPRRNVTIR